MRTADSIDIGKTNLGSLIWWKIYACYTCHLISRLSLSLLVFRIHTNHPYDTLAMDDLALVAHLFYRRTYFHHETSGSLFIAISNTPPIEVVRRKLNQNSVARKNSNKMLAHLS